MIKMQTELENLLEKSVKEELTEEEINHIMKLAKERYDYGDVMEEACPNCNKQLVFRWSEGPSCWHYDGGCGKFNIKEYAP